ncbi:MAG: 6-bladed beta-propeller [Candidatus Saccharicenans sp.]|nr:6-bladed beta-propeller [Candidatus Saccharicenans sp.]
MRLKARTESLISFFRICFVAAILVFICLMLNPVLAYSRTDDDIQKIYSSFRLEEKLRVDTGNKELIDRGLFDINNFAVDSEGNIYIVNGKSQSDQVFVMDKNGQLLRSFARKGQGPGEVDNVHEIFLTSDGNIFIQDSGAREIAIFSPDGQLVSEAGYEGDLWSLCPLPNGHYVGVESIFGARVKEWLVCLNHYDAELKKIEELDRLSYPNPFLQKSVEATPHQIIYCLSGDRIYSGYPERGYTFLCFDLKGKLIRKISRPPKKSTGFNEYKKIMKNELEVLSRWGFRLTYPDHVLPFYSFFADEHGYLFVMTFEPGQKAGEYLYEIISPEGDLVKTVSLGPYSADSRILAKILNGYLYWVREKESGEKEFLISRIY